MRTGLLLAAAAAALSLAIGPPDARAAPVDCGTMRINGGSLPVVVTRGSVSCEVARRAVRKFFPVHGRARQIFSLAGRRWFCADAHGQELLRGGVAHCISGRMYVAVLAPVPAEGATRENPIRLGKTAKVGQWRVRVVSVTPDARDMLTAYNENTVAESGRQSFVARISATYLGTGSATFDFLPKVVGPSAVSYDGLTRGCGDIPDYLSTTTDVFTGGTLEGNRCWEVSHADALRLVMYLAPNWSDDGRVYFALTQ